MKQLEQFLSTLEIKLSLHHNTFTSSIKKFGSFNPQIFYHIQYFLLTFYPLTKIMFVPRALLTMRIDQQRGKNEKDILVKPPVMGKCLEHGG